MADARFFRRAGPILLKDLAKISNAKIIGEVPTNATYEDVKSLTEAGPRDVSFLDNKLYTDKFVNSHAGACVIEESFVNRAPKNMVLLVTETPYLGYAKIAEAFYPPEYIEADGISIVSNIDPKASVSPEAHISAKAVIQSTAEIGPRAHISPGSVIGAGVVVGADARIGPNVCLSHCLIGDRVIIHAGACIGQDGFGFAISQDGHYKVPQIGRVIVEEDVEIGANTTIDRGAGPDTVIGAGTKIDNLVQIGHNVNIGKGCIIVSQVGISGSTEIGDYVMIGGQAGFAGHLKIGSGCQIAAKSGVFRNLDPGSKVGGFPAKPIRNWLKEIAFVERLTKNKGL